MLSSADRVVEGKQCRGGGGGEEVESGVGGGRRIGNGRSMGG